MSKPFVVETNASDFALGGVLMQDGPVAFESRKLKDVERRYSVHEKELLAVVHCLRLWRHYLLGSPFMVKTDNTAVSHFMTQPKLTSRQTRLAGIAVRDSFCVGVPGRLQQSCGRRLEPQGRFSKFGQDKADHQKKAGLLQPLPIPTRPWESVSMDYISGLPKVGDLGSIIVVVDRLSKYATFIAAPKHVTAERTAHLFFKHIVKYWGLPKDIVSDRDSHFIGVFWTELFKIFGSKLSMSSSYHPQSDGQTERFNSMLEEYLRHFVRGTQKDWVKLLDVAHLYFNAQKSSFTNKSAFEIVTGEQPLLPHTLDSPKCEIPSRSKFLSGVETEC
ncbi:UNVERIFIED_CONTAM: Transposon Tf2-11 polyprotein [Sesamum latifolium]|uniref:Transposon Tf2-11 polyprotein n=1 Tax=Sesamum latifolium TaxID=2727402 RepID=A0AAW2WWQ8_9LAMI